MYGGGLGSLRQQQQGTPSQFSSPAVKQQPPSASPYAGLYGGNAIGGDSFTSPMQQQPPQQSPYQMLGQQQQQVQQQHTNGYGSAPYGVGGSQLQQSPMGVQQQQPTSYSTSMQQGYGGGVSNAPYQQSTQPPQANYQQNGGIAPQYAQQLQQTANMQQSTYQQQMPQPAQQQQPQQSSNQLVPYANNQQQSNQTSTSSATADLQQLRTAATSIDSALSYDELHGVSPIDRIDTRQTGLYYTDPNESRLNLTSTQLIPPTILQHYNDVECKSFVGLLPEINRAYITIDNKLFLWNYGTTNDSDFTLYDELNQIIVSVAVLQPKAGVFVGDIPYVLVVATPVEIILFACKFDGNNLYGHLTLYPTQYRLATDNVQMLRIVGTSNGRILCGGNNGHLYEIQYDSGNVGWLPFSGKKIQKVDHSQSILTNIKSLLPTFLGGSTLQGIDQMLVDTSRRPWRLFTLSQDNSLHVWSLGELGTTMTYKTGTNTVFSDAVQHLRSAGISSTIIEDWLTPAAKQQFRVVNITTVTRYESDKVVLVAITNHGHRLYYTLDNSWTTPGSEVLRIKVIRLSPSQVTPASSTQRFGSNTQASNQQYRTSEPGYNASSSPSTVHTAYVKDTVCLLADATPRNSNAGGASTGDALIALIRDPQDSQRLTECVEPHSLTSRIADMSEVNPSLYLTTAAKTLYARGSELPLVGLNEFAVQHLLPPRQYLVLTSTGLQTYAKSRPSDALKHILLVRHKTGDDTLLRAFYQHYGLVESCAMTLMIITSGSGASQLVSPTKRLPATSNGVTSPNRYDIQPSVMYEDHIIRLAKLAYMQYGSEFELTSASTSAMASLAGGSRKTARTEALVLYASRLCRPFWDWSILGYLDRQQPTVLRLRYDVATLQELIQPLTRLQQFVRDNIRALYQQVDANEQQLLTATTALINVVVEALHLLIVIASTIQTQPAALQRLASSQLDRLREMKFYDLIVTAEGHALLKSLIRSTVAARTTVSSADASNSMSSTDLQYIRSLAQKCPTFFGEFDMLYYQGMEYVKKAQQVFTNSRQREALLSAALDQFSEAVRGRVFPIVEAASLLRTVHYYTGAVQLVVTRLQYIQNYAAQSTAGQGNLLALPPAGSPSTASTSGAANTTADTQIDEQVAACYTALQQTLSVILLNTPPTPEEQEISQKLVPSADELAVQRDKALATLLSTSDPQIHNVVYTFYHTNNLTEQLYTIHTPYVVQFLQSQPQYVSTLKDYYIRNHLYKPATLLLTQLALREDTGVYTLHDRIGFLTRAIMCAKKAMENESMNINGTNGYDTHHHDRQRQQLLITATTQQSGVYIDGDFISSLQERLNLANVQDQLLERLKSMAATTADQQLSQQYIQELNTRLLNLEQLYTTAQSLSVWDLCLELFALSGEANRQDIVTTLYRNLFRSTITTCNRKHMPWNETLVDIVSELVQKYSTNEVMWPLTSIVAELEYDNYRFNQPPVVHWVVEMLLNVGIAVQPLMDAYTHVVQTIHPTDTLQYRLLIAESIVYLLEAFTSELSSSSASQQRQRHQHPQHAALHSQNTSLASLLIASALQQLEQLPHTDTEADQQIEGLIQRLQDFQQRLKSTKLLR